MCLGKSQKLSNANKSAIASTKGNLGKLQVAGENKYASQRNLSTFFTPLPKISLLFAKDTRQTALDLFKIKSKELLEKNYKFRLKRMELSIEILIDSPSEDIETSQRVLNLLLESLGTAINDGTLSKKSNVYEGTLCLKTDTTGRVDMLEKFLQESQLVFENNESFNSTFKPSPKGA